MVLDGRALSPLTRHAEDPTVNASRTFAGGIPAPPAPSPHGSIVGRRRGSTRFRKEARTSYGYTGVITFSEHHHSAAEKIQATYKGRLTRKELATSGVDGVRESNDMREVDLLMSELVPEVAPETPKSAEAGEGDDGAPTKPRAQMTRQASKGPPARMVIMEA